MNGTPGGMLSVFSGAVRYAGSAIRVADYFKFTTDKPARKSGIVQRLLLRFVLSTSCGLGYHRSRFMPLLEIKNLKLEFGSGEAAVRAVDDVSLSVGAGETVCLVGESGSGKSVTALSIARLVPSPPARYTGGGILLNGRDVLKMSKAELRQIRGGVVSYVFQEPAASLNPVIRVGNQIKEVLELHKPEKLEET